jgi:hypothetical protein
MTRVRRCVSVMIALVIAGTASSITASRTFAAEAVDLLLVLAADVSRSVDAKKFQLQREGYAAAVTDQRVLEAIRSGPHSQIAICFVEWSGSDNQKIVIDWALVRDGASAQQFAAHLVEAPRAFADRTSISGGIDFAMGQFARAPFTSPRRTIDVSGDGTNNSGRDVNLARDEAVAQGVTINGLAILSERPLSWNAEHTNPAGGLEAYFRNNVVGGPGAFVIAAQDFNAFGQAIISKLIAEIAFYDAPRPLRVLPGVISVAFRSQWLRLFSTPEQSQAAQFGHIPVWATLKRL